MRLITKSKSCFKYKVLLPFTFSQTCRKVRNRYTILFILTIMFCSIVVDNIKTPFFVFKTIKLVYLFPVYLVSYSKLKHAIMDNFSILYYIWKYIMQVHRKVSYKVQHSFVILSIIFFNILGTTEMQIFK